MSHKLEKQELNPQSVERGYEVSDVALFSLTQWGIWLGVFVVGSAILAGAVMWAFMPRAQEVDLPYPPSRSVRRVPEPILQAHPKYDMVLFRQAEDKKLNFKGPINGQNVIPVAEAMRQVAAEGLPARAEKAQDPSAFVKANVADGPLPATYGEVEGGESDIERDTPSPPPPTPAPDGGGHGAEH